MKKLWTILFCGLLAAGCANPVTRVTAERYADICGEALSRGELAVAEDSCEKALKNVDWGKAPAELRSQRLYNLALVKRRLAKFREAESLLAQSLAIEARLDVPVEERIARRQIELAVNFAGEGKWNQGAKVLDNLRRTEKLNFEERSYAAETLRRYAVELRRKNDDNRALSYERKALELENVPR